MSHFYINIANRVSEADSAGSQQKGIGKGKLSHMGRQF